MDRSESGQPGRLAEFTKGLFRHNPVFVLFLGLSPLLAISTHLINALVTGVVVLFTLVGTALVMSLCRAVIPARLRTLSGLFVAVVLVTVLTALIEYWQPAFSARLGIYLPLVAVTGLVSGRGLREAVERPPLRALPDAAGMGIGFVLAACLIAIVREVIGFGTITLFPLAVPGLEDGVLEIPALQAAPVALAAAPAGALLVLGLLKGLFNSGRAIRKRIASDIRGFFALFARREERKGGRG